MVILLNKVAQIILNPPLETIFLKASKDVCISHILRQNPLACVLSIKCYDNHLSAFTSSMSLCGPETVAINI